MPAGRLKRSLRATLVGLVVNSALAVAKFIAGVFGHSHALVADAVESLADIFSSLIVWRGLVVASEPADEDHPYGHGKAEPIAAAVVSALLLAAAVWIAFTAIREIQSPHQLPAPYTLVVLIVVILIKEGMFRFLHRESMSLESFAMQTDAWHHRSDAITSLAAFLGISVALIGGKGYEAADDVAAFCAAIVIAWNGWKLSRSALHELMDRAPGNELSEQVRQVAESVDGVNRVEKCLIRKMGYQYYVDLHIEVDPQMTVVRSHAIAHQVKDRIRAEIPNILDVLVHIEPGAGEKNPTPKPKS